MRTSRDKITISPEMYVILALMLLLLPIKWMIACFFAAFFHEMCHLLAVRLFCGRVTGIRIGGSGAVIEAGDMAKWQALFCSLAGPLGGGALVLLGRWFPELAVCAAVQSVYNLLPIYPMDGGRALKCLTSMLFSSAASRRICIAAALICILTLSAMAVYAGFWLRFGVLPVAAVVLLGLRVKKNFLQTGQEEGTIVLP